MKHLEMLANGVSLPPGGDWNIRLCDSGAETLLY